MTVVLDGESLVLADVVAVARAREPVKLAPAARERMAANRALVEEAVAREEAVYGLNTGVGSRKRVRVPTEELPSFNRLLVESHRVARGARAPDDVVRAHMLRLANGFAKGTAGVRPELAERIVAALNDGTQPRVRILGSVGQADLAQNGELASELFASVQLEAKEGLALLNNNSFSTAWGALALADARRLVEAVDVAGALDLEAFAANVTLLHPEIAEVRPYPGLVDSLERIRRLLEGSYLWQEGAARNLQDPLTFRCLPQIQGAARDALAYAERQLAVELNASQENPLVVPGERRIVSVANFEILPLAAALDFARIGLAPLLTSANERMDKLLQAPFSGLADGLAARPGLAEDSLAELGVVGQAITAEARLLAQPVSFELASSTHAEGIEDRMTLAPLAARRLAEMVALGEHSTAVELAVSCQAVELRDPPALGAGTRRAFDLVRERFSFVGEGMPLGELDPVVELVRSGELSPQ
jgi:histidine ammonia-lyase